MATIYKTPKKRRDPATGKMVDVYGPDGKPVMHPKWRTVIFDHTGKRKAFTLTTHQKTSQKQADLIELREREIKNGIRPKPEAEAKPKKVARPFGEVFAEYMAWGRMQGGRRGLPWDDEHAFKKERELMFWAEALGLKEIAEAEDILPKVEEECRKMFEAGNCGKTVSNKVQHLRALFFWCKKRKYLKENPLDELGKFDTEPTFVRRAMALEEYNALMFSCADHRRLLYEVASCSGLRENELRKLEPKHLDRKRCGIRVDRKVDKGRIERLQPIPAALMERLVAFVASGEAKELYRRFYHNQGDRPERKEPPKNPLLYVPSNPATALKKDLEAAGVPYETEEGRLDFHALRTAYINFLLDVGANPKTTQSLARHATLEMTMNVYGRASDDRKREAVEALGEMLSFPGSANAGLWVSNDGQQNSQISTIHIDIEELLKDITLDEVDGYIDFKWCGREDLNLIGTVSRGGANPGHEGTKGGQNASHPGQYQEVAGDLKNADWTEEDISRTQRDNHETIISTKRLQNFNRTFGAVLRTLRQSPDLTQVAALWPALPPTIKMAIFTLAQSQTGKDTKDSKSA